MFTKTLDPLASVGCLRHHQHVRLAIDEHSKSFAHVRMIIDTENTYSVAHNCRSHQRILVGRFYPRPRHPASFRDCSSFSRSRLTWSGRFGVCNRCGNRQLDFSTRIKFTPDCQLASRKFGALAHSGQAIVSFTTAAIQNLRVDAFSVVQDAHSKLFLVVADLDLNPPRAGVPEGVACGLAGDAVHLV